MSSLLTTFRTMLGPHDPRSEREIEDDIDAEFAFHIEQIEAELIEQGVPRVHAADLARARFGNQQKLKQRCKRIALEERIMLQRINTVLMIVVMLAVVGVSIQMYVTQRHNTTALLDISTQIAKMRIDARLEAREAAAGPAATTEPASGSGVVYLEGDVDRPGTYVMPKSGDLTIRRLLAGAGGVPDNSVIELVRITPEGQDRRVMGVFAELRSRPERDVVLQSDDLVAVKRISPAPAHREAENRSHVDPKRLKPGGWRLVDKDSQTGRPNARLHLQSQLLHTDDMRSIRTTLTALLNLGDQNHSLKLEFEHDGRLLVHDAKRERKFADGKWRLDDNETLSVTVPGLTRDFDQPLRFLHEDQIFQGD